ncbi:Zn-dependent protease [Longilinea arvoryzae]|uniref:Zn-dependent protease n=1 Tax=Longilinea arvoryzae TaxID=360412 RepID=A0A0S7BHB9_9CHLR|nr:site-2 protease family protein [Longilinea arvoryzae]GAP13926.1 Zn-dependent protease [Longilinea arvoryzae]
MFGSGITPALIITRVVTLIIAFTVHEFSHAFVADRLGDDTPRSQGRLTLNPIAHLDLVGSIMLLLVGFGWAKPVQINTYAVQRRSPAGVMWVSLAGPFSNLLMAILASLPLRFGWVPFSIGGNIIPSLYSFLFEFMSINLILMLFNFIPVSPLDGEKIAIYFFPPPLDRILERIHPYGAMILMAIVFLGPMLGVNVMGWIMGTPMNNILRVLLGGLA